ncbi:beta strand repeat-containing protein [Tunturiibacter lichenicola]|uniref:beta strand repeat-containing protein n=1 Tax=Tunturiibacter lichenicola TaxID=2051959 RepID=UPI003D9B33F4
MKTPRSPRRLVAGLCGFIALILISLTLQAQSTTPPTAPQQLLFAGLLGSSNSQLNAQFNAIQSDASGNLYILLDQKDGVRLLKTDPTATNILAQAHFGASGDIGLAMALDPAGNICITGTTTSGSIASTAGAAFPSAADTSINSFIGKFDQNLNPIFITYAGSPRTAAAAIAATADAVFITGSIFGSTLPVTPSAIIQTPAFGSLQNGFVEKFNASGTSLLYATYLSGQSANSQPDNTAPSAIAADSADDAYIAGFTTATGYPTLNALIPNIVPATPNTTSGFLTKLTPGGDGILFSTFIPGPGITSIAIDPTAQNLLVSGSIAPGQFPIATVASPLVNTNYQTLLRLSLDGSTVLASTLLAPGTQSTVTAAPNGAAWISSTETIPAWLLPLTPLSTIGNSYALRVTQQNTIDQTIRFGGLPTTNPNFASAPVALTGITTDATGQPTFAGSASPTASTTLLSTETYDLPLTNTPTPALPSNVRSAALSPSACTGSSLCAGSAAYLAKLNPTTAAASLALSTDSPNITLRNLGSLAATNVQLTATNFTIATNCQTTLAPGSECSVALTSTSANPGTLTVQAANATTQTATLAVPTTNPNPIVFSPKELDFGIQTATSPIATRTVTVTNLSNAPQTFASQLGSNQSTPYIFAESSSDCPSTGPTTKTLAPGATCYITLSFTPSSTPANDGFAQIPWTIDTATGTRAVLLTGYTQAADLNLSATEIDFGTQFGTPGNTSPHLPRYLYLSNNSANQITHTPVTLQSPFTLTDSCPTTLAPHSVCQLAITYQSAVAPSADATTLTLDEGLTVLISGTTLPPSTGIGQSVNPNLTVSPTSINFPTAVLVTTTSSTTQTVNIGNTGAVAFPLALTLTGDFTDTTDCTATLPGNSTCTVVIAFAPSQSGTRQGLLSVTTGSSSTPTFVSLSGTGTPILSTGNNTLAFGSVIVGQPSVQWYKITAPFPTLTATTSAPDFRAILVEDTGFSHGQPPPSAFLSTFTGTCTNCWLGVQFTPSTPGPQTASVTLSSSTSGTPAPLTLTGTGLALTGLILNPLTQDFGSVPVHSISAPLLFTLTNLTAANTSITNLAFSGDFALSTAPSGGQPCSGTLAPNASCFFNANFAPTTTGQRTGTITLQTSTGPITATLSGFGTPDPGLAFNPTSLIFNNVPGLTATQQTITLTNTGTATLQIATPTNTTQNFSSTTNCTTLTPAATCTITVSFIPTTATVTDTLQLPVTSSPTGPTTYTIPLTGAYTTESAGLQIIPNQADYGPDPTTTLGSTRQFTINNLTSKSLALNIALPRQFLLNGPACAALAPNASCNFNVTFLPLTNGDITGTLFAQANPTDGSATLNGLGFVEGYGIGPATLTITGNIIPNQNPSQRVLNFGQIPSGQSGTQTLTLTNSGTTPLTIRRLTSQWPFLITATTCGATLTPTQSCTATLIYTPTNQVATGTTSPLPTNDTGTLTIESDALTAPDLINLTGSAAPISVAAPTNNAPLISYALSQSSLTFPTTQVGNASNSQTVTLANTGTTTIHITALQTTSDFTFESNCGNALLPSASCIIIVTFAPQPVASNTTNNRISAIQITSDSSNALDFISLLGTATPSPITITPISLNFGSVQLTNTTTLPLQITNTATTPAIFQGITASGDYSATSDCPTPGSPLAPATSCTAQITFTPTQTGTRTGLASVATSLSTLPINIPLTGIGIQSHLQAVPSTLNFGDIAVGASAAQTLTLTNTGTAPITSLTLAVTGDYAITVPCTSTTLAPGNSCELTVTFTPTALGPRNGTLSSTNSPPITIPLTGTGVPSGTFTLTVNGAASATATIPSEQAADYTLQLTPQSGYIGTVVLNCTPITIAPNATCSLLPSSIALNGAPQNSIANINTVTEFVPTPTTATTHQNHSHIIFCLLPASFLFFWTTKGSRRKKTQAFLLTSLITLTSFWISGCGRGGTDPNLRFTPPGTYQYQITASSTTGVQLTQTVTLNLIVTAAH